MLLILIKSPITMNRLEPIFAKVLYTFLCWSRDSWSFLDSSRAVSIYVLYCLVWFNESMRDLLSRILPSEFASSSNSIFSNEASLILNYSSYSSNWVFLDSNSGCSKLIVIDRSCPSRPLLVTVKFTVVIRA